MNFMLICEHHIEDWWACPSDWGCDLCMWIVWPFAVYCSVQLTCVQLCTACQLCSANMSFLTISLKEFGWVLSHVAGGVLRLVMYYLSSCTNPTPKSIPRYRLKVVAVKKSRSAARYHFGVRLSHHICTQTELLHCFICLYCKWSNCFCIRYHGNHALDHQNACNCPIPSYKIICIVEFLASFRMVWQYVTCIQLLIMWQRSADDQRIHFSGKLFCHG